MMTHRRKRSGGLFLMLFGVPFLAVGCGMGYASFRMLAAYFAAQGWIETAAEIQTLELKTSSGEDGPTYSVQSTYLYTFAGRRYQGSRVGLPGTGMNDNIGSWQETTHARLQAAFRRGQTVPCFVNPHDPQQAVLDRDMRLAMLCFYLGFATAFGGAGALVGIAGLSTHLKARQRRRNEAALGADADQPWLVDPRWATGIVQASAGSRARWLVAIAICWNTLWLPVVGFIPREVRAGHLLALLALIGPAIGLALAAWALRAMIHCRKFGRSYFECEPLPGVIGGHLRGDLVLAGRIETLEQVEITLLCENTVTTGSGKHRHTNREALWTSTRRHDLPDRRFGDSEVHLPIDFVIPGSCRPTDDSDPRDLIEWKLLVRGPAMGVDLALDFEVPVFRTSLSAREEAGADTELEEEPVVLGDEAPPPARIVREQDALGNLTFTIPCWPGFGMAVMLLIFAAVFSAVGVFTGIGFFHGNWFLIPFMLVFGGFGLLMWLGFFSFFGSYRVEVSRAGLQVHRSYGLFAADRSVPGNDFTLSFKESASSNRRKWYSVHALPAQGRKVQLAGMIEGKAGAKWLIRQIESVLSPPGASNRPERTLNHTSQD